MEEVNNEMHPFHSIINFEIILKLIDEAFFLLNKKYEVLYVNPSASSFLDLPPNQLAGRNILELLPLDIDLTTLLIDAISEQGKVETTYFFNDKSRWYEVTAYPLNNEFALIFKDVDAKDTIHEELSRRKSDLELVLDTIPHLGWVCASNGEVTSLNKRWEEYTGLTVEAGLKSLWSQVVHPDDIDEVLAKWNRCIKTGEIMEHEYRFRRHDGMYRWHLERTVPTFDDQNNISRWIGTATDIHEQRIASETIKESEIYLRKVLDTIPQIAWIASPAGDLIAINKRWKEYTGLAINASSITPAIHPDDVDIIQQQWIDSLKTGTECENLYRIRTANGEYRWHIARTRPLFNDEGKIELWVGTATDIDEQKQAEEKLLESERHLREVLDTIPHIIFITDRRGVPLYHNKQWSEYRGIPDDTSLSLAWQLSVHPEDRKGLEELGKKAALSGEGLQHEYRLKNKNGEYRWHIIGVVPLKDDKGEIVEWIGTANDIHDRKLAEQEVRKSNNFIQKITETSPALITVYDLKEQKYIYANNEMFWYLDITGDELLDLTLDQILERVHPDDHQNFLFVRNNPVDLSDNDIREFEFRASNASGDWVWLKSRTKVFDRDQEGNPCQLISVTENVTEIKKAAEELSYTNNFITQITEATPDFIAVFDLVINKYVYVNQAVFDYWMIGKDKMLEMTLDDLLAFILPEDRTRWLNHIEEVVNQNNDEIIEIKYQTLGPPGEGYMWVKSRTKVFRRDKDGDVLQIMSISQNITAEQEAEKALKENQRIQTLMVQKDELFSIASHELKTPITSMKAGLQIVKRQIEQRVEPEILLVFLTQAIKQVNKLSSLIADLLDITKIQAGKLKLNISRFHIHEIISEAIMQVVNSHTIELINKVEEPVEADKTRIEQVITNYLSNAVKYSPDADRVIVTVEKEDDCVRVSVTDFGIGIPKDHIDRVFDRFYRADETSQRFSGLGLGLYISSEIIERHHGKYGVISEEGKGSTFWFCIPMKYTLLPK